MTIMAYVDKARVEGTLYDISPSPTGNLDSTSDNAYTSSDVAQASATTWTNVNPILATEQHRSIFSKLTSMIKNIRYLYNLVGSGTFAPGNGTTVTDVVNNKAPKSHTHTAAQLPTSNSQINSTSYVPTSALIYSMNQTLSSLNDAIEEIEGSIPPPFTGDPNNIYDAGHTLIATLSSTTDTNNFCNMHNHNNGYNGLSLGQRIQINDGVYNKTWYIVGFDCEADNIASDGTPNNNGYGICLIPENYLIYGQWNITIDPPVPYISSTMHTSTLPTVANNLKNVLGDHLINRNVLLADGLGGSGYYSTTSHSWTTSYATLMSNQQFGKTGLGDPDPSNNPYDVGEANYKLPIYTATTITKVEKTSNYVYWTRCVTGNGGTAHMIANYTDQNFHPLNDSEQIKPLIYIR